MKSFRIKYNNIKSIMTNNAVIMPAVWQVSQAQDGGNMWSQYQQGQEPLILISSDSDDDFKKKGIINHAPSIEKG